eukprot:jgi/Psemu1/48205/gm1.48205_g
MTPHSPPPSAPASIVPKKGKGKEYYHHQVTFVTRNKCFKNIGALLLVYTDLSCFYALGPLTSMTNNLTQAYTVFHVIALSAMFSKLALATVQSLCNDTTTKTSPSSGTPSSNLATAHAISGTGNVFIPGSMDLISTLENNKALPTSLICLPARKVPKAQSHYSLFGVYVPTSHSLGDS